MGNTLLSIKDVAHLLGISAATVNYYTNLGLFQPVERKGNKRFYNHHGMLIKFETIKKLRKQGYSLALIQQKLRGEAV